MELSILVWPVRALMGAISIVLWNVLQDTKRKAEKAQDDLAAFKTETYSNFPLKTELKDSFDAINKTLEKSYNRIHDRLDRIEERMIDSQRHPS